MRSSGQIDIGETEFSLRRVAASRRRCKRCGREAPGYLEQCRHCPAVLGEPYDRQVTVVVPELAHGRLPERVLPAAVLAVELSTDGGAHTGLASRAREPLGRLLAALHDTAVMRTLDSGVFATLLTDGSLAESAAAAARAAATLGSADALDLRAGLAVGLVDGAAPLGAAVVEHAPRLARAATPGQTLAGYGTAGCSTASGSSARSACCRGGGRTRSKG